MQKVEQFEFQIKIETKPAPFRFSKLRNEEKVELINSTLKAIYATVPKSKKHTNQITKFIWEQYKTGANSISPECIVSQVSQIEHQEALKKAQMTIPQFSK